MLIAYVSSAIHDYEHPGINNPFLINTKSDLAILYNDKSPLENHHVSATFFILQDHKYDFMRHFKADDQKKIRERIV